MNTASEPALAFHSLVKHYDNTIALRGIDLSIAPGQVCAILGRNGAGKTTSIHCALGLTQPTSGHATILGQAAGSAEARARIGVMLQDADLPDMLTAREHLSLFANYYQQPANIDALIETTEIGGFADTLYKKLSGGQKRRVQFAVALVGQPDLLFLDEPTTGLDQDARQAVWHNVRQLADQGRTVVLTTHYLEEADALADRICIINQGAVIADGDADTIRQKVGGSLIRCVTSMPVADVKGLAAVREATDNGRRLNILSDDAPATLRDLLARDTDVTDLTVKKPSLEEAFASLTAAAEGASS
ncbi:MAG: ATP-binding cassette domain-containing protein [Woeseiaceae bacterium]